MNTRQVTEYYEKTIRDYQLLWINDDTLGMHYGYWDNKVTSHSQSLLRLNQVVAQKLKLTAKDFVLDAGCGLGGSSFWIAKHIGSRLIGVSITPDQVKSAKKYAQKKHLVQKVDFELADYTKTNFPDNYFDAAFAIETICHLDDKTPFFTEMSRILKPGGRLVVADFTLLKRNLSQSEQKLMNIWLSGWMVPNIWTREQHLQSMKKCGFRQLEAQNYSDKTIPSSKRLFLFSLPGVPLYYLLHKLKLLSNYRLNDAISCYYQWIAKKRGLWGHFLFYGEKPI
ncbi:MAG: Methyltransferase, UbiE/COQ5 family [Candidatus Gottesmanbacteria bacterium GW2011_GWB1_43_11]|uniref:Methyltransferase, UbiE/COQ5 family n=1 Tax=Candidatus Gottesmanbacteria bacterium GW2011_GWB1_43_11 TaxID=1618446 RepID=A0A0G1FG19_9BACT|nr:MAG: Methyltransferase, UbiE/COQ5 family [Candidatus Gottesmanbacteria bacterium GW2011_GWA2_42_16]KKS53705.1 MAG: Methyltransferase, UbiE/COQ5 family [Candidatus Gottesmanbacteria bacterium GW2011_GWA1_42_26]KKS81104.1 MAG: Methyltransferase, UbiE/COQ5 family [Candidatus Gottesmanbacteria bacterium GW2011_GWC1_43_10]KKS85803.1 MAG: Methyltransferase, UbiE/COQ5 family [Candidatus Gottesmanbacteria bacterium GW2011_GWB1_43_11]